MNERHPPRTTEPPSEPSSPPTRSPEVDVDLIAKTAYALRRTNRKLVLAESCTSGLIAASLAQISGISQYFCGSAVVYREATKTEWLGIDPNQLAVETAVSPRITSQLADLVLQKTPESTIAVAITGHLGPDAPESLDGVVFLAASLLPASAKESKSQNSRKICLKTTDRRSRQCEAVEVALSFIIENLTPSGPQPTN